MKSYWSPTVYAETAVDPLQVRYERRRVTMLLKVLGLADQAADLWANYEEVWGERRLTFESFDRLFPTFPWQLVAQSFFWTDPNNPWMTLKSWLTRFKDTFVWKWYWKHLVHYHAIATGRAVLVEPIPELQRGRPLGMIFPLQGIRGGVILHNGKGPITNTPVFVFNAVQPGEDEAGKLIPVSARFCVESYTPWLKAVARTGWTPDTPPSGPTSPTLIPKERQGFWTEPWMMKCCKGNGPACAVLAWLCRILLADPPGGYESRFLGRDQGERCVEATHARIKEQLPPHSERQIRSALCNLRKAKLIITDQTRIRLNTKALIKAGACLPNA